MSLLSPNAVEAQLSAISLLQAMFPLDGELELGLETVTAIPQLERDVVRASAESRPPIGALILTVRVLLDDSNKWPVEVEVQFPVTRVNDPHVTDDEAIFPNIHLRHPDFL